MIKTEWLFWLLLGIAIAKVVGMCATSIMRWINPDSGGSSREQRDSDLINIGQIEADNRAKEMALCINMLKTGHDKEVKDAYSKGYGEASAEIFSAMRKNPDIYKKFIDDYSQQPEMSTGDCVDTLIKDLWRKEKSQRIV